MMLLLLLLLLLSLVLSGCTAPASVLDPASPEAVQISGLFWGVFAVAAVIFVVVEGLLIFAIIRFRQRPGDGVPDQVHGNMRLEVAWTLAPALILVGVFAATVQTMAAVTQPQPGALRVKVTAYQWWWQIQYPDLGIDTATDLHVPIGQPVEVELVAGDVIHSFWAPGLFGKSDVIPGRSTWTRFTASRPGMFRGQCAEFCGTQHANMGFLVVAEPPDRFDEWVKRQKTPYQPPAAEHDDGAEAFLTGACSACHTVAGTAAQGKLGPDLTHFGSRQSIAALTLDNTPDNLSIWLADPQAVKPGNKMPKLSLSHENIEDLVDFLESLK